VGNVSVKKTMMANRAAFNVKLCSLLIHFLFYLRNKLICMYEMEMKKNQIFPLNENICRIL